MIAPPPAQPADVSRFAALIREQADAEVQQIASDAEQRAERLRVAADAEVVAIDAAARRGGEERGRRQAAAVLAEAETGGHLAWLWARERLLEDVLARVATQLVELAPNSDTIEALARLVEGGLGELPHEPVRVRVATSYAALVEAKLQTYSGAGVRPYRVEAAAIDGGGVIVETEDGRLCFDNSFATRLRRQRDELRGAAAAVLFAE